MGTDTSQFVYFVILGWSCYKVKCMEIYQGCVEVMQACVHEGVQMYGCNWVGNMLGMSYHYTTHTISAVYTVICTQYANFHIAQNANILHAWNHQYTTEHSIL